MLSLPYHPDSRIRFAALRGLPRAVLLQSAARDHPQSRFDIMSAAPASAVSFARGVLTVGTRAVVTDDPLAALADCIPDAPYHDHFRHGFIGAFGYALPTPFARPVSARNPTALPDLTGGIYDWAIVTDHALRTTTLWSRTRPADQVWQWLAPRFAAASIGESTFALTAPFASTLDERRYGEAFASVMSHLSGGDCYQVNLARHFCAPYEGDAHAVAWAIYRTLVQTQSAPFCAYLECPEGAIACLSPERLLRVDGATVTSMPIKGTRPRAAEARLDHALGEELTGSEKDRAENLMIVDLVRNDLGRVCRPGSIHAPAMFALESFPSVHHLVSTVVGERLPVHSPLACLAAAFPAGSITGAPKYAAMGMIDHLEPVGRSAYCGAIGYLDSGGLLDTNVAIRTLVISDGQVHCWGGGGIVADSQLESERSEIDHKIERLLQGVVAASRSDCNAA